MGRKLAFVLSLVVLTMGCAPKIKVPAPQINLPSPQVNINVPQSQPQAQTQAQPATTAPATPQVQTQFMVNYAPMVFYYAFSAGGYWVWLENLKPGDWVKFEVIPTEGEKGLLEKAFLKVTDDGKQWWRVSYTVGTDNLIYEALFDPNMTSILRVRAKTSRDKEPYELPVAQNMGYVPPTKLTKESIEGATVGMETVEVPAGIFTAARHVKFGAPGSGTFECWLVDNVPGGVVKYRLTDSDGKTVAEANLVAYGTGATTILNSY